MRRLVPLIAPIVLFGTAVIRVFAQQPTGGSNPPTGSNNSVRLVNPLKGVDSIEGFLGAIIDILVIFATPIIILFIMYAGYLFVTAQGDTGKVEDAKRALLWSVVGGVIVLGAKLISEVIKGTVAGLQ